MQDVKTYRIFWNNKFPDFWKWHNLMCEKYVIEKTVTVNFYTELTSPEEKIKLLQKAISSGLIERIIEI